MNATSPLSSASEHAAPRWKNRSVFHALLVLLFVLGAGTRCYYITNKTFVHVDESASITLSTYTAPGWSEHFAEGVEYTGDDLRRLSYSVKPGLAGLASDLAHLRMDNRDLPHTSLYYSLLRVALVGMDKWDTNSLMLRGGILNLLFFSVAFVILYKLARMTYGEDKLLVLTALAVATLNPATLSSALLVRTYELQAMLLALTAWLVLGYTKRIEEGLPCPDYKTFLLHGLSVALCLLSGYFALFYIALLGALLIVFAILRSQQCYIPYFSCLLLLALVIAWAIFSPFLLGLFLDRGAEASQKISLTYITNNTLYILDKFIYMYSRHVTGIAGAAVLLLGALLSRGHMPYPREHVRIVLALLCVAILWSLLSFTLAPYKTLRYIMPAAPLVMLLACVFLQYARYRAVLIGFFLLSTLPMAFMQNTIEYYRGEESIPHLRKPYVVSLSVPWRTEALVPYLADEQKIVFYNICTNLHEKYMTHAGAVLLVDDDQFRRCGMAQWPGLHNAQKYTYFTKYEIYMDAD